MTDQTAARPQPAGDAAPLAGRVALVTGAGRGIGAAIAERLGRAGAAVVVNDLDGALAEATAAALRERGGEAVAVAGDVTDPEFAERFVACAISAYDRLDVIVNNAGFIWGEAIGRMSDEQWDAMLDVHLSAPFRILRAAAPEIRARVREERARGERVTRKVVNVSSVVGLDGQAGQVNYGAAKAGAIGLTKSLAKEWGRWDVNVNAVALGLIETRLTVAEQVETIALGDREVPATLPVGLAQGMADQIPLGRLGTVAEAAGAVYLLCLPESDYVTGEVLVCGGGFGG
nr:SDR family NAD(P)-dependent oxidoreductase [Conexibacter arvalis]